MVKLSSDNFARPQLPLRSSQVLGLMHVSSKHLKVIVIRESASDGAVGESVQG